MVILPKVVPSLKFYGLIQGKNTNDDLKMQVQTNYRQSNETENSKIR